MVTKLSWLRTYIEGFLHKVTWPFDQVVLWDDETNEDDYISTAIVPMTTKLG